MKILFYLAMPMAFIVTMLADIVVALYYKGDYRGSIITLRILIWGAAGVYMTMALGNTMVTANLQRLQMKVLMAMAVVNIVLNYFLILNFGIIGSAFAMVCTQWLMVIIYLFYLERFGYRIKLAEVVRTSGPYHAGGHGYNVVGPGRHGNKHLCHHRSGDSRVCPDRTAAGREKGRYRSH